MDRHGTPRIAFFGGSFDPPHLGHLAVAKTARDALRLDTVLFAPVGAQPLKPEGPHANFVQRVEMVKLAIAEEPGLAVSLADAPRADGGPNYTLDTLRRLRGEMPASGELFCLMGADSLANLRSWRGAAEIPFAASLVVASRPGQSLEELGRMLPEGVDLAPGTSEQGSETSVEVRRCRLRNRSGGIADLFVLAGIDVPISATEVRAEMRTRGNSELVLPVVAKYVREHGLYR